MYRNEFRVVGFEVEARSIDTAQLKFENGNNCILPVQVSPQYVNPSGTRLLFLYSVEWKQSDVSWASRWDIYLGMSDVEIHWFSIINSLIVVFFLSGKNPTIVFNSLRLYMIHIKSTAFKIYQILPLEKLFVMRKLQLLLLKFLEACVL